MKRIGYSILLTALAATTAFATPSPHGSDRPRAAERRGVALNLLDRRAESA